jgi:hypothetical protein
LTLVVKPVDDPERPVDAEQFLHAATKWLTSLASFATESGLSVRWEIAELKRSSAVLEVVPIDVHTGVIAASVARDWGTVVQEIETTGRTSKPINPSTVKDIEHFTSTANDLTMVVSTGDETVSKTITLLTQKRLKEAVAGLPSDEYSQEGTIKGNLAVLNSWNQDERWFRLRVPLAPEKQIRCVYSDPGLIGALGDTFEKPVNVTGLMHYRTGEIWPHRIDVRSVQRQPALTLDEFLAKMQPVTLPPGADSVSAVRSLRDAE